jgi:hypothetical protein
MRQRTVALGALAAAGLAALLGFRHFRAREVYFLVDRPGPAVRVEMLPFDRALARARDEKRWILAFFTADW